MSAQEKQYVLQYLQGLLVLRPKNLKIHATMVEESIRNAGFGSTRWGFSDREISAVAAEFCRMNPEWAMGAP